MATSYLDEIAAQRAALRVPFITFADVMTLMGDIPPDRMIAVPAPGSATEADVIAADGQKRRLELVSGVLIEKASGVHKSRISAILIGYLQTYAVSSKVGATFSGGLLVRLMPETVRIPDVSFYRWERFPGGKTPRTPVNAIAPSLAVEILSASNRPNEMEAKLRDYFQAGVELVWYIDPTAETARLFTSPQDFVAIDRTGVLDGGAVLPGFQLSLGELLDSADR